MNSSHLLSLPNSGDTFYFRKYIPVDLIEYFGGVKQFRISLKCAIKSQSIRTSRILDKKVSRIFEEIRLGMKSLDIEDIKEILKIEIRKQILHAHHVFEGTDRWNEEGLDSSLDSIKSKQTHLKETLKTDRRTYQKDVDQKLEGILKSLDIEVDRDSINFKKLRNKFIDLYLLRYDWMKELFNFSTEKTDDDFKLDAQQKLKIILFPELTNPSGIDKKNAFARGTHLQPVMEQVADEPSEPYLVQSNAIHNSTTSGDSLSVCAKRYFQQKRIEDKREKNIQFDETVVEDFIEIIGDIEFTSLTKKEVSYYVDVQTKMPPSRKKSVKYRTLSIGEKLDLKLKQKDCQTPQNINKRLTKLNVFANWGIRQGVTTFNPFSNMKFKVKKIPNKREPFTTDELKKILKPETYLGWTVNFKHKFRKDRATNQLPYYWCFLIGIFSGMRTNEICQMRLSDVKKENNIWFMFVEDSEDTTVKTENSIRKIPMHPQLIELGFIDYVANLKRREKNIRIFWELKEERDGYASKVSRHFNEKFLPAIGKWKEHTKVLYCTRHTFINKLYSAKVDENVIKTLLGHEKEFTMKNNTTEVPYPPELLIEEI